MDDIVRDVVPRERRVALLCQVLPVVLAPLEPLRQLLAAGRELLQGNHLVLRGIDEALPLPLQIVALHVKAVQLVLALPLLALLYLLPQGLCLQNGLRVLEQCTNQGPRQGLQTIGTHTTGGATLHTPHGHGVLARTAIIQRLIALADAQLPRRLPVQRTLPTPHEGAVRDTAATWADKPGGLCRDAVCAAPGLWHRSPR